jgi:hypothetical protein
VLLMKSEGKASLRVSPNARVYIGSICCLRGNNAFSIAGGRQRSPQLVSLSIGRIVPRRLYSSVKGYG